MIFLKFADNNYRRHEKAIHAEYQQLQGTRREKPVSEIAIEKCGFYLPDHTRYDYLLNLPEEKDIAKALEKFKNQVIPRNTVMFTSLSFAFGKMGIASRPCSTNQQINSVIVNRENNPKFVYPIFLN